VRRGLFAALYLAAAATGATATLELYDAAKVSFPTLAVPVGVRAVGMGEAYTAAGDDVYALHWNPAGLSKIGGYQLGLAHNEWSSSLGLRQELLAYGQSLGQKAGLALSANYFSLGSLDERDSSGALQGQSAAFAFNGTIGYGRGLFESGALKAGLAVEYGTQSLFGTSLSGFGGSLGLLYDFSREFCMGLSVLHLGGGYGGFSPPQSLNLGLSGLTLNRNLTLALEGALPFSGDPQIKAGAELLLGALALRGGYRAALGAKPGDLQSGLTAGAGFKAGAFSIDYAFVPYGDLSTTHRVAATIKLPEDFFRPKLVGAEATSVTAKSFYEKGIDYEKNGELLMALVQYQRAEESYPEALKSGGTPQLFYLNAKKKIGELQAEMNKKGGNTQVAKLRQKFIDKAQDHLKAGRYREAIEQLQQAKTVDPQYAAIEGMLKQARQGLEERLGGYRREARAADRAGKLPEAIDNYERVLGVDPSDGEAQTFFSNRHKEIQALLRNVHRRGIDLYVSGQVEEAIKIWSKGRALDHFHDVEFSRDIDKARKLLDLRGQK
jgi:tetratricopeptide (TPR) repeat protein